MGGRVFSGLAATSFPGWWPRVLPAGRGLGCQWDHPFAGEGFGEPVRVALGEHLRNAKLLLSAVLAPEDAVPELYLHPDHRRRLRRDPVRSDLNV